MPNISSIRRLRSGKPSSVAFTHVVDVCHHFTEKQSVLSRLKAVLLTAGETGLTLTLPYKGFNYTSYYNGAYEDADSLVALSQTGANAVALNLQYGIDSVASIAYADPNYTDSLDALASTIQEALGYGLSVMVRPLIDFVDPDRNPEYNPGDWRAYFNPSDFDSFFASYKQIVLANAEVAQANGAQLLCIGAEIDQLCGPDYLDSLDRHHPIRARRLHGRPDLFGELEYRHLAVARSAWSARGHWRHRNPDLVLGSAGLRRHRLLCADIR